MFKLNDKHHHHKGDYLLQSPCTMLLTASVLILLLSLCPQFTQAQLSDVAKKLKLDKVTSLNDISGAQIIDISLNNNRIKPGDLTLSSKLRSLDLTSMSWPYVDEQRQYSIILLDFGVNGTQTRNLFTAINVPGKRPPIGQQVVVYEPPNVPCVATLKHRLVLLVYRQADTIDLADIAAISVGGPKNQDRRNSFNLENIKHAHSLSLEAANIFLAAGESNGICSASSGLYPNSFLTLFTSFMIVMVLSIQQIHSNKQQL